MRSETAPAGSTSVDLATISGVVEDWLSSKGTVAEGGAVIALRDGR